MTRFAAAAAAVLVLSGGDLAAQEEVRSDPPSLEAVFEEAKKAVEAQREKIAEVVKQAVNVFGSNAPGAFEAEAPRQRARVLALGSAAAPELLAHFQSSTHPRVLDQIGRLVVEIDDAGFGPQIELIAKSGDPLRAPIAARILGAMRLEEAIPTLRESARAKVPAIRAASLLALAQVGDEASFPAFEAALGSADASERLAAVEAYGLIGRKPDHALVAPLIKDSNPAVALAAIRSLGAVAGRTRNPAALGPILDAMRSPDPSVVDTAVEVIGEVGKIELSRDPLREVVLDEKRPVALRKKAAIALYRLGDSFGRDEFAKPIKAELAKRPRRPQVYHKQLSDLYWEFGDESLTISASEDAMKGEEDIRLQVELGERIARCHARLGQFRAAFQSLKKARGNDEWYDLRDDPDFREMAADSRYRKHFVSKQAEEEGLGG